MGLCCHRHGESEEQIISERSLVKQHVLQSQTVLVGFKLILSPQNLAISQRLFVFVLDYLLCGQSIQLLDVRRYKSVKSDQNHVFWQGGEEEAKSLHQPHALAALHTRRETAHITHDSWRISVHQHLIILFAVCSPYGSLSPVRPAEGGDGELILVIMLMIQ